MLNPRAQQLIGLNENKMISVTELMCFDGYFLQCNRLMNQSPVLSGWRSKGLKICHHLIISTVQHTHTDGDKPERTVFWPHRFLCIITGLIRLRSSPPPRLQGVEYVLNVTATDDNASGGPQALSSTAQVIVGVDDVNNNKPVFEKVG